MDFITVCIVSMIIFMNNDNVCTYVIVYMLFLCSVYYIYAKTDCKFYVFYEQAEDSEQSVRIPQVISSPNRKYCHQIVYYGIISWHGFLSSFISPAQRIMSNEVPAHSGEYSLLSPFHGLIQYTTSLVQFCPKQYSPKKLNVCSDENFAVACRNEIFMISSKKFAFRGAYTRGQIFQKY